MKTATLGDICEVITRGISPKYIHSESSGICILNQKCIRNKQVLIGFSRRHDPQTKPVRDVKILRPGDLLVNSTGHGTLGRTALVEDKGVGCLVDSHITIIRPKKGLFEPRYFAYLIGRCEEDFIAMATGTSGQTELPRALLLNYEITYDESPEVQRLVVARLDATFEKIDRAIELTQKNIDNVNRMYDAYLKGCFKHYTAWKRQALEENVKFIDYRGKTPKKTNGGMRLITAKNIKLGKLNIEPKEFVDPQIYESWMVRGIPKEGDVLFTTEAPLANVAQLDTSEKVVFAQRCIILQPDRRFINPSFLKYMLLTEPVRSKILSNATGTTVSGIKASLLKKIDIYLPNINSQDTIVLKINDAHEKRNALLAHYKNKVMHLRCVKSSLLEVAFANDGLQ